MKDGKVKILVLLATHNGEKYIQQQINSVLNQEGVDVDILISDDFSNDRTFSILKSYSNKKYNNPTKQMWFSTKKFFLFN